MTELSPTATTDMAHVLEGLAFFTRPARTLTGAGTPTTWTMFQQDGPDHLGLRCNELPEHQMALITSGCVPSRPRRRQVHLGRGRGGRPRQDEGEGRPALLRQGELPRPTAAVPLEVPYCGCKLTRSTAASSRTPETTASRSASSLRSATTRCSHGLQLQSRWIIPTAAV